MYEFSFILFGDILGAGIAMIFTSTQQWVGVIVSIVGISGVLATIKTRSTHEVNIVAKFNERQRLIDIREPYASQIPMLIMRIRNRAEYLIIEASKVDIKEHQNYLDLRQYAIKEEIGKDKHEFPITPNDPILTNLKKTDKEYSELIESLNIKDAYLKHDSLLDDNLILYLKIYDNLDSERLVLIIKPPSNDYEKWQTQLIQEQTSVIADKLLTIIADRVEELRKGGNAIWKS